MDVYFVNCLLACTIAYGAGYWYGKRVAERRAVVIVDRILSAVRPVKDAVVDSPTKH